MWIFKYHSPGTRQCFRKSCSTHHLSRSTYYKISHWVMLTSAASVPTVCASLCQLIHLAYDGTSFLQVVLCYQLHSPLPARKMLFVPCPPPHSQTHTHTPRRTQRDGHLQSVCHLFCWHLRPHGIVGETAICCRQGWTGRGQAGMMHHAALFCWSELCEVLCC